VRLILTVLSGLRLTCFSVLLSVLVKLVLHIAGGLAATVSAQLLVALKSAACLDVLATLKFALTLGACGL
jgi:hypothetical protein